MDFKYTAVLSVKLVLLFLTLTEFLMLELWCGSPEMNYCMNCFVVIYIFCTSYCKPCQGSCTDPVVQHMVTLKLGPIYLLHYMHCLNTQ